jgi:hypothetical protein
MDIGFPSINPTYGEKREHEMEWLAIAPPNKVKWNQTIALCFEQFASDFA